MIDEDGHNRLIKSLLSNITKNELRNSDTAAAIIPLYMHHLQNTTSSSPAMVFENEKDISDAILNTTTEKQRSDSAVLLFQVASCSLIKQCMLEAGFSGKNIVECDPVYVEFVKNAMNSEMSRINQLMQVIPELAMLNDRNHQSDLHSYGHSDETMDKALMIFQVKVCSILKQSMMQAQFQANETYECTQTYIKFARKALNSELQRVARFDVDRSNFFPENIVIDCDIKELENGVPAIDTFDVELKNLEIVDLDASFNHINSVPAGINDGSAFEKVNTKQKQPMENSSIQFKVKNTRGKEPSAVSLDGDSRAKIKSSGGKERKSRHDSKMEHGSGHKNEQVPVPFNPQGPGQLSQQQIEQLNQQYISQLNQQEMQQLHQQPFIVNPFYQASYATASHEPSHHRKSSSKHKRKKKHRKGKRY